MKIHTRATGAYVPVSTSSDSDVSSIKMPTASLCCSLEGGIDRDEECTVLHNWTGCRSSNSSILLLRLAETLSL